MVLPITSFVLTCAICSGIFYVVRWHLRRRSLYELASTLDGPPVLPIIGNAHMFVGNTEKALNTITELIKLYPSRFRVWFGPLLNIIVTDPEEIKVVCLSPKTLAKSTLYVKVSRSLFGNGLLLAPVSIWQAHRKLIQPTFNPRILNSFVEVFFAQSKIFTDRIENNSGGPEFEVYKLLSSCTLDMICETAMGVKVEAQTSGNSNFVDALREALSSIVKRALRPKPTRQKRGEPKFSNTQALMANFAAVRRASPRFAAVRFCPSVNTPIRKHTNNINSLRRGSPKFWILCFDLYLSGCNPNPRREAFLDLLMNFTEKSNNLSDEALRDEIVTMVTAGNDTSASTTAFTLLMLASHPDVQNKIYEELHEIYGDADTDERPVLSRDLPRMKYLENAIKETLRLFPVAPLLFRDVSADLNTGDHTFPTGSTIVIAVLSLHRNEKYWPDPLKFDPDRFLPEENSKRHPFTFLPFSGGPRNCIGLNYAMMSMKTLLATILRRYVLKKDDIVCIKDIRLKYDFIVTPVDPITIRIEKRSVMN